MRLTIVSGLVFGLVSCQTNTALPAKKVTAVKAVAKKHDCADSKGPEVLKNGNFELTSSHHVSYWKGLDDSRIQMGPKNNLLRLFKDQNISQTLNYHSEGYYVSFQYNATTSDSKLLEVELLGQKLVYSPKKVGKQTFEHVFLGSKNYTLTIRSLSDEKVLIDNISVKPIDLACSAELQSSLSIK